MCSTMYNYCLKFRLLSQLDFELCQHQEILVARINSTQMKRECVDSLLNSFLSKLELTFHRWKSRVVIAGTSDFMNFYVIFPLHSLWTSILSFTDWVQNFLSITYFKLNSLSKNKQTNNIAREDKKDNIDL